MIEFWWTGDRDVGFSLRRRRQPLKARCTILRFVGKTANDVAWYFSFLSVAAVIVTAVIDIVTAVTVIFTAVMVIVTANLIIVTADIIIFKTVKALVTTAKVIVVVTVREV